MTGSYVVAGTSPPETESPLHAPFYLLTKLRVQLKLNSIRKNSYMALPSSIFRSSLFALLLLVMPINLAHAAAPIFVIVYLEVSPQVVAKTQVALSREARNARAHSGNLGFVALQRDGIATQFMMLSLWTDEASLQSYSRSATALAYRIALQQDLIGPYDERRNIPVLADDGRDRAALASPDALQRFAVTHIDLIPETLETGIRSARALASRSTAQPGTLTFDLLNQASRANHFASLGVWRTSEDLVHYKNQSFVRQFREQLPLTGCIYDERIYHAIL